MRISSVLVAFFVICASIAGAHAQQRKSLADVAKELEALAAEVAALSAQSGTTTQAVQELTEKVTNLEQAVEVLRREQASIPDAVERLDALTEKVDALRGDLEAMRTQVANIEQPSSGPPGAGGGTSHSRKGFVFSTEDNKYSLTLGGYVQTHYFLITPSGLDSITESSFQVRRARVGLSGHTTSPDLSYKLVFELKGGSPLLDAYADYEIRPELEIRAGQAKLYLSREFATSSKAISFIERSEANGNLRYDRDLGVWAHGKLVDDRLYYIAGLSNGAGRNNLNDNIDFVTLARVDGAVLGKWMKPTMGDIDISKQPRLQFGGAFVHDLVQVPEELGGLEVGNRDVDDDLVLDNIRAMTASLDATFRWRGLEVYAEWMYRHERWGTILSHSDNEEVADAVDPDSEGHRNYQTISGHVTYFAVPKRFMAGLRLSHSRIPLLGVGGRSPTSANGALPLADRLFEADVLLQLYAPTGYRQLGFMYTLTNFNAEDGAAEPPGDIEHRFLLGLQLTL